MRFEADQTTKYVVNIIFNNIEDPGSLKDVFFSAVLDQIEFFESKSIDAQRALLYSKLKDSVNQIKAGTDSVINGTQVQLKIPILADRPEFDEISIDGRRLWLRNYLESEVLNYARNGLLEKTYSIKDNIFIEHPEYERIFQSFENALENANDKVSKTFWIDGE